MQTSLAVSFVMMLAGHEPWITSASDSVSCPLGYLAPGAGNDTDSDPLLYHPRFHIMPPTRKDRPTGMNDINAMFYFQGIYHITYQDHIDCPDDVAQGNQSFGHVITRDLVHLYHMPPVLVDVPSYDGRLGPWDGPGFVCNGKPMIIYNSHFQGPGFGIQTKTGAFPISENDSLLTNWTRASLDPSTAFIGPSTLIPPWKGEDGAYYTSAYDASANECFLWKTTNENCTGWTLAAANFSFCADNSPELYPTPPPCDDCPNVQAPQDFSMVAKQCLGETDGYIFGHLEGSNSNLQFVPSTVAGKGESESWKSKLFEPAKLSQFEDGRSAWSESLWDPRLGRRIMFGWVPPGVSPAYKQPFPGFAPLYHMGSLLRDVRYDDRFKLLTTYPIAEYTKLREGLIGSIVNRSLSPVSSFASLGSARQLDFEIVFLVPADTSSTTEFGVSILRSSDHMNETKIYISRYIAPPPPPPPPPIGPYMVGTDLPGDDWKFSGVNYTDPHICQAQCNASSECKAWVYVGKSNQADDYPVPRCCLKNEVPEPQPNPFCTSGVKSSDFLNQDHQITSSDPVDYWQLTIDTSKSGVVPGHTNNYPTASMAFPILETETEIRLRVVLDRSIIEAFAQGGRAVVTATAYAKADNSGVAAYANFNSSSVGSVLVQNASAWDMGCAWVDTV